MNYKDTARKYANQYGIDPRIYEGLVTQESAWNPQATSRVGAYGLTQVMPDTAKQPGFGVAPLTDLNNTDEQLRFGAEYLSAMVNRYDGNYEKALAAYNWGAGNADGWDGNHANLPQETRDYIQKVNGYQPQQEQVAMLATRNRPEEPPVTQGITRPQVTSTPLPLSTTPDPNRPGVDSVSEGKRQALLRDAQMLEEYLPNVTDPVDRKQIEGDIERLRTEASMTDVAIDTNPGSTPTDVPWDQLAGVEVASQTQGQPSGQPQATPMEEATRNATQPALSVPTPTVEANADPEKPWHEDFFGLRGSEDGGGISRLMGWDKYSEDQRDQQWLALGAGLLSGRNWSEGLANGFAGVHGVRDQWKQDELREQQINRVGGGGFGSGKNIQGYDKETGAPITMAGTTVNGVPFVVGESGDLIPAYDVMNNPSYAGVNADKGATQGAGGIPNAIAVDEASGMPTFRFKRESEGKSFSNAYNAITAMKDLEAMTDYYGVEALTSLNTALHKWATTNSETAITPTVLNAIISDSGMSGQFAAAAQQYLQAILRDDTGAAYTGVEIADYAATYLPRAGEDPQSVADKRRRRANRVTALASKTGSASTWLHGLMSGQYENPAQLWQPPTQQQNATPTQGSPDIEEILQRNGV